MEKNGCDQNLKASQLVFETQIPYLPREGSECRTGLQINVKFYGYK